MNGWSLCPLRVHVGSFEDHCSRQCNKIGKQNSKMEIVKMTPMTVYLENPGFKWRVLELEQQISMAGDKQWYTTLVVFFYGSNCQLEIEQIKFSIII